MSLSIGKWIFETLSNDATLQGLLAASVIPGDSCAVYDDKAPEGATHPLVRFKQMSAGDVISMGPTRLVTNNVYLVEAIKESQSNYALKTIYDRFDSLLTSTVGTVDNLTVLSCIREEEVQEPETTKDGKEYRHVGGMYRIKARYSL